MALGTDGCISVLHRLILTQKEQPQTIPVAQPNGNAKSSKQKPPKPQPSQQQQQNVQAQPQQQQPAQAQQPQQKARSRSRSRNNKREDGSSSRRQSGSNVSATGAVAPTMILQRSPKGKSPPPGLLKEANGSTVPMSKADGIAAGEAILGMISQPQAEQPQQDKKQRKQQQQTAELLVPAAIQPLSSNAISKEQLKQTLISLLDDTQFFDQIYHAYVDRVLKRAA